jgi:sec-independent protein translocase protein TatC
MFRRRSPSISRAVADFDDPFAATRMPVGDHIEDLRRCLWRAVIGFMVGMVVSFFLGHHVLEWIAAPARQQLGEFHRKRLDRIREQLRNDPDSIPENAPQIFPRLLNARALATELNLPNPPDREWISVPELVRPLEDVLRGKEIELRAINQPALRVFGPAEGVMVYIMVCAVTGLVLSSPWVFWQIWSFVAAGLYAHEKRHVNYYLPFSLLLFVAGVVACQLVVLPRSVEALLWFDEWLGLEPDLRLNEWLGFAVMLPLIFGVAFETPLVMLFLNRLGILDAAAYRGKRRQAWFVLAFVGAVLTPTPDAINLLFLWLPLIGLFELGIVLCRLAPRPAEVLDRAEV